MAIAGHAALLGYLASRGPQAAPGGAARPVAFSGRLIPALPAVPAEPAVLQQAPAAAPPPASAVPLAQAPAPRSAAAPAATQALAAQEPPAEPQQSREPPYLPRGELTVPPKILGPADVPFPDDVEGMVHLDVKLTLFIDEEGRVQRIRVDSPQQVHPSFERAIRETFMAARFAPGELHRKPVRSQMRLEISFEAPGRSPVQGPSAGSRR